MELRHVRYFIAVAEELNFNRAAERLNIAQPPLSQQIRKLEEELDILLFYRTKQKVQLTDGGKTFLKHAYQILREVDISIKNARRASHGQTGQLSIGFTGTLTYDIFPRILKSFREKYPSVNVIPRQLTTTDQVKALEDKKIDVGIVCTPIESTVLDFKAVHQQPFIAVLPATHPLASSTTPCDVGDLAKESFIMTPRKSGPGYYDRFINICYESGFSPNITQEAHELQNLISLVASGMGVALVPSSMKNLQIKGALYKEIINNNCSVETTFVCRKDTNSQVVNSFFHIVEDILSSLKDEKNNFQEK